MPMANPASPFGGFRKRTITAREFARAMASIAAQAPTVYRVWIKRELDPGLREELMFAVSKVNDCRYCSWAHHEWASVDGISEEELAQIEQMDPTSSIAGSGSPSPSRGSSSMHASDRCPRS